MQGEQGVFPGMDAAKKKPARKRDYVFDGLVEATGIKHVSKLERDILNPSARALAEKGLKRDDPDSKTLIRHAAMLFLNNPRLRGLSLTARNLVTHWDKLMATPEKTVQPGGPSRKEQAERDAKRQREDETAWKWWRSLDLAERVAKAARWGPAYPEGHIVLHEFDRANRPGFEER